jgi:hypothetical protein
MKTLRSAVAVISLVLLAPVSVCAANVVWLPNVVDAPTRFSAPGVYTGEPQLPLTLSMILAGAGPEHFDTITLVKVLAGSTTDAEVAALKKKFGDHAVTAFVTILPFAVEDSLKIVKEKGIPLPSSPDPNPQNGEALAGALWAAGQTGHSFNVEVMFDRTLSHGIHIQVMKDIDAKYGIAQDADLHVVLNQAMLDLAAVYDFDAQGKPQGGS